MPSVDPHQQKRFIRLQLVVSAILVVVVLLVLRTTPRSDGPLFWALVVVAVFSVAEVAWFLVKYLRLARDRDA